MIGRLPRHWRPLSTLSLPAHRPHITDLFSSNRWIQELNRLGRVDEARQLFDGMSQRDAVSWNTMIAGYAQHGRLYDAQSLFDRFAGKNVRTWTVLLSGYAKQGCINEAQVLFQSMPDRNVISWNAMVSGYVRNGDLDGARRVFDEMPERNLASWNSIITGHCHIGLMREAQKLFDVMGERDIVSYMVMISGYVDLFKYKEAWYIFSIMQRSEVRPDQSIFVLGLSAVIGLDELGLVEAIRTQAIRTGYERDVVVGTSILNAYTRSSHSYGLDYAMKFLNAMPERNEYSWNTIISALSQAGKLDEAVALYEKIPEPTTTTKTALMTAYFQNGKIHEAKNLSEEISYPSEVTWNAMLAGYCHNGMLEEAMDIFLQMPAKNASSSAAMISGLVHNGQDKGALQFFAKTHRSGALPNQSGLTSALFACANLGAMEIGRQIHGMTIKMRYQCSSYVGNGLISMYGRCNNMEGAYQDDGKHLNSLLGLSPLKNYVLKDAHNIFVRMPVRDVVSWTAIISAYAQAGLGANAVELFLNMLAQGVSPNQPTFNSLLSACSQLGSTKLCQLIHCLILKHGFDSWVSVCNALVTAYSKCGCLDGLSVFEEMPNKDVITWNAALAGCALNGQCERAIEIFERMLEVQGISPNEISFLGVLTACSHAGLVEKGWAHFKLMKHCGISPLVQHYTCMVDLLGRAGKLSEAEAMIVSMPEEADAVIWEALLAACKVHRNLELGERVAERIFSFGTPKAGTFALLSNMYAMQGRRDKAQEICQVMRDKGVAKEREVSWIQIKNKLHYFFVGDKRHEQIQEIHSALNEFYGIFRAAGYSPDTKFAFQDMDDEQKGSDVIYHSEKLAVIYGLLNTPSGATVQIMKNLRICGDCHGFFKFMSVVSERRIVVRDGHRFHHFQNGLCSCRDYW